MLRRFFLASLLAAGTAPSAAQQRRPQKELLLVGVATALFDSGFARHIQRALARDTGLAIEVVPGASGKLLDLLERGELDVALTHAPEIEAGLVQQGLLHDRRLVAANDFVLAGPVVSQGKDRGKDALGLAGSADAAAALALIASAGAQGRARYVSSVDRSGAQLKEAALFKAAGVVPQGGWFLKSGGGMGEALAQAAAQGAYVLVDRGTWSASRQRGPLGVLVQGDPRLADSYHAMRSFRSNHPAAKLFLNWLTGPTGRRAVNRAPGGFRSRAA
ncbi:LysR substrate-binding domain-containing protein [Schlegelella sp. S2-27]|uniref:LysR substrate-binding domain-containing protein n=1 Tax=Caldimonas mangrovi TaxID=2944811 RepID=A0ABT0YSZ1_9BURK|nr:LysR substrate-binding domain-containing protein [Caldimonas mangrovi]